MSNRITSLINRLTEAFSKVSDSNNYKLLSIDAEQFDDLDQTFLDTQSAHYVEEATDESLDNVGELLNLERETNETDDQFRARIEAKVPSFIGGGTQAAIIQAVAEFLDLDESYVSVEDGYDDPPTSGNYGHFRISITVFVWNVGQNLGRLYDLINDEIRAAGTVLDSIGLKMEDAMSMSDAFSFTPDAFVLLDEYNMDMDDDIFVHRTDITSTESLNVVD